MKKLDSLKRKIKEKTSTSYSEALIDGIELAMQLLNSEISVDDAFEKVMIASEKYVQSTRSM